MIQHNARLGFGGLEQEDRLGRGEVGLGQVDVGAEDRQVSEEVGDRLAEEGVRVDQSAADEESVIRDSPTAAVAFEVSAEHHEQRAETRDRIGTHA